MHLPIDLHLEVLEFLSMVLETGYLVCRSRVGVENKNDFRKKMNSGFGFGRLGFGRTLTLNPNLEKGRSGEGTDLGFSRHRRHRRRAGR